MKEDCEQLLVHIRKCVKAMDWDGYVDAGVIGYFIKLPFKAILRHHFLEIERYIKKLNQDLEQGSSDFRLEYLNEYSNEAILYQVEQLGVLAYKQYEHRIRYLEKLEQQVHEILKWTNGAK